MVSAVDRLLSRVRRAARAPGWNRFRLAEEAGLGINALRNVFTPDFNPKADTLRKLEPVIRRVEAARKRSSGK
jgi:ribosome-binding protein aMBF1 (putative translation factor)